MALPESVRRLLALPERTWIIVNETNTFIWPGSDLERNADGDFTWGVLPPRFFDRVKEEVMRALSDGVLRQVRR